MDEGRPGRATADLLRTEPAGGSGSLVLAGGPSWSPSARIVVLASLVVSLLATSAAPTPLYVSYARAWRLTPTGTSVAFGVYALSLLAALLVLGRLSDYVGRRPVLFTALGVQFVSLAVFATAGGLVALLVARVLLGIATGLGVAAVGAALLDVDRQRGTVANSMAPGVGSGLGAIVAALAVQFLPAPTRLIYVLLVAVLLVQALALVRVPETSQRVPGALASLRPDVRLPASVRGEVAAAAPVLFAVWALSGLFGSLGPALVRYLTGSPSPVLGTVPFAVVGVLTPLTAYRLRASSPRSSLSVGIAALALGVVTVIVAVLASSGPVLYVGALLAGVALGSGFRGSMQLVLPAVQPHERAGTLSLVYIVAYLGFGVPAILAGVVDAQTSDVRGTTLGYSAFLLLLALAAAAATWRSRGQRRTSTPQAG